KSKKTEVNNGLGKPYYTQRNNKEKPGSACNVTSMIIALCAAGWPVENFAPDGEQPEDELMRFIFTDPATLTKWKQIDPRGEIPPNQWHEVLAYGADRFLKKFGFNSSPVKFLDAVSVQDITAAIDAGGSAVVSGVFPQEGKAALNHIVAVVGYGTDDSGFYFIVDDPWGDYHSGYKNQKGKGIRMPLEDFDEIMKPQRLPRKWAHIIRKFEQ
ncbi:MAG: hypothetical protein LBI04_09190, partial [Treponema sp.]|nr:hypothetical protein [Treponema sp.]